MTAARGTVELSTALGTDVEPTTERMHASLADPALADRIAAAVELQREHFDLLGLQLGYVYTEGALILDGTPAEPGSPSDYHPTARPGARVPLAWLDRVGGTSTLDLVPLDRSVLVSFGDHDRWAAALDGAPVAHVRVGVDTPALDAWREVCDVRSDGALLVRPDQHVAWRAPDAADAAHLGRALGAVSGRVEIETAG